MKIRQGFVSNSSSSSFCICGMVVDEKVLNEILKDDANKALYKELKFDTHYPPSLEYDEDAENMEEPCALGVSFTNFPEDKTIRETKDVITTTLKQWFGEDAEVGVWEEGWYNG